MLASVAMAVVQPIQRIPIQSCTVGPKWCIRGQITAIRQPKVYQNPFYDSFLSSHPNITNSPNNQVTQADKLRRQNVEIGHKSMTRRVLRPLKATGEPDRTQPVKFPNRTNDRLMVSHRLHAPYLYQA